MKVLLIINPVSGTEDKVDFLHVAHEIARVKAVDLSIYKTTGKNDLENLRRMIGHQKPHRVIVAGGDGTFRLAIQAGEFDHNISYGLVPFGSANGLAKELSLESDPVIAFSKALMSKNRIWVDLLLLNDKHLCAHIADCGLNANVIKKYDQHQTHGLVSYARFYVTELSVAKPFRSVITTDKRKIEYEGYMLAFANASKYGTGAILNPNGSLHDGKFELICLKKIDAFSLLTAGLTMVYEDVNYDQYIEKISCTSASVVFDEKQNFQVDGEYIGEVESIKCEILPKAVKVIY